MDAYNVSLSYGVCSGYSANKPTLAECLEHARHMRVLYETGDNHYTNVTVSFALHCDSCAGNGRVATRTRFKFRTCKACLGHGNFPLPLVG